MARIPYADPNAPELHALVDRIVAERGGVLHLYQMLLHSPPVAEGWLALMTAVRQKATLSGALREMVIIRIALLNDAPYEAEQHVPIALREGVSQRQIDDLIDWERSDRFTPLQCAVLALTDGMTRDVHVDDRLFDPIRPHLSDREILELVVTIAAYNMVSRVLEALKIASADPKHAFRRDGNAEHTPSGGIMRVNYFQGQLLGVDEFVTEQHYLRARLRRHNRFVLGSGIVSGMNVTLDGARGAQAVTIAPGLAIDARGEEVEVTTAVALPLPDNGRTLLVQLNYAERLTRPVPVAGGTGDGETQPSRVEETYRAFVAADAKAVAVPIARLAFARGRWSVDPKFKPPRARTTGAAG